MQIYFDQDKRKLWGNKRAIFKYLRSQSGYSKDQNEEKWVGFGFVLIVLFKHLAGAEMGAGFAHLWDFIISY